MQTYMTYLGWLFITLNTYRLSKKNNKPHYILFALLGIATFTVASNFIFTYRVDLLDWSFSQILITMTLTILVMFLCMLVPTGLIYIINRKTNK